MGKGYTPSWGVGRHILGSQVFDYWYTPDKFMIEHYSDGEFPNIPPLVFLGARTLTEVDR